MGLAIDPSLTKEEVAIKHAQAEAQVSRRLSEQKAPLRCFSRAAACLSMGVRWHLEPFGRDSGWSLHLSPGGVAEQQSSGSEAILDLLLRLEAL